MSKGSAIVGVVLVIIGAVVLPVKGQQGGGGGVGWSFKPSTVRVQNEMLGTTLYIRCQSSDTDLGIHYLLTGQFVSWSFRANIRATTLFWCVLKWNTLQKSVIIYDASKDEGTCAAKCWRGIRPDGVYFFHEYQNYWEKRYSW